MVWVDPTIGKTPILLLLLLWSPHPRAWKEVRFVVFRLAPNANYLGSSHSPSSSSACLHIQTCSARPPIRPHMLVLLGALEFINTPFNSPKLLASTSAPPQLINHSRPILAPPGAWVATHVPPTQFPGSYRSWPVRITDLGPWLIWNQWWDRWLPALIHPNLVPIAMDLST